MLRHVISHRKLKKLFIYLINFLFLMQLIYFLKYYFSNYDNLIHKIKQKNLKSIQLLTGRFHFLNWKLGHELGQTPFKNCAEKRCYAYRSLLQNPSEKADGVMVHAVNLFYMVDKSKYKRNPKQLWLYYSMEAQTRSHCSSHYDITDLDDWFNLTATFKLDSDLFVGYSEFRSLKDIETNKKYINEFDKQVAKYDDIFDSIKIDIENKKKDVTISWLVSHCGTPSRREEYIEELSNYIKVDSFGRCGDRVDPCANAQDFNKCFTNFMNRYKFYLAFENSLCKDYVSEKYWQFFDSDKLFRINLIPVVRGAQSSYYKRLSILGKSYIDAQEFKTPKDLADYLIYLNKNTTAYMEYFKWKIDLFRRLQKNRNKIKVIEDSWNVSTEYHLREPFCKLCSLLHNETYLNSKTNKVWKLSEWFTKKSDCWDHPEPSLVFDRIIKFIGYCI